MFTRARCAAAALVLVWMWGGVAAGQGVTAWFQFENDLLDSVGGTYAATITGGPTYVAGMAGYGQALQLDASDGNDMVRWADVPKPAAFTVSMWLKLDPNTPAGHKTWLLDSMESSGGMWKGWQFKLQRTATAGSNLCNLQWIWGKGDSSRRTIYSAVGMYGGGWHHIVGTHDGVSTAKLYLDGDYLTQGSAAFVPASAAYPMTLNNIPQSDVLYGTSQVDEIALWSRALSAAEIAELYERGISWPLIVTPVAGQEVLALLGSPAPAPVTYTVLNDDAGNHTVDISECDENGNPAEYPWLALSTTQIVDLAASGSATVDAIIDHSALALGNHAAWLKFSEASTGQTIIRQIALTVLGCQWSVTPGSVGRYHLKDSGTPVTPAIYTITNSGKDGLTYTVQEVADQPWLTLDKTSGGPLAFQATDTVTASINPAGLTTGQYACDLRISNNCSPPDEYIFKVTLTVETEIAAQGLLAYYRFEDSAHDWTGHGWNGTPAGTPTYDEGKYGRAITFDGPVGDPAGDGVNLGDIPGGSEMSVALWFRSGTRHKAWLVNKISRSASGWWTGWQIKNYLEWQGLDWETPVLRFTWCHDGLRDSLNTNNPNRDIAVRNLYDGNWHLIVMTIEDIDGALGSQVNVRGYYDGALLEGENIWTQNPGPVRFELLNTKFEPAPDDTDVWLSGDIDRVLGGVDELSFWNRALTAQEVAYLYTNGFLDTRPWPDADEDGDVDMLDFAALQRCWAPAGGITDTANCLRFDRDQDVDVDEADVLGFINCATGPNIPLDVENAPMGCDL